MRSRMNSFDKTSERVSMFRYGFTLVELLVVIAIIGILMGIAVPAIFGVIETANSNKQKLELGAIEQAIERYQQQYGDYPPDFSNWTVVERHYRKIFPRIAPAELNLLQRLLDVDPSNDISASPTTAAHDPARMDRAEAIVWTLGGYSSNPITPFTGPGGPLSLVEGGTDATYQVNVDRDNEFFDFDTTRLDLVIEDTDNYYKSSDSVAGNPDLFPHYQASDKTPFV
ncbi:MAG: prepilin-type N-terminal cleavage/methylation domain-containing protein, partial [Planctomycetota bacterium]|nr:prepilin-type N-terminal cleavage/methylation domain-containing protein [Planctomycetota bacterium]